MEDIEDDYIVLEDWKISCSYLYITDDKLYMWIIANYIPGPVFQSKAIMPEA